MSIFYCYECSLSLGYTRPTLPDSLTGTDYQLEKFLKHNQPTRIYSINSVFDPGTYEQYQNFVVDAAYSGSIEMDDRGRINYCYIASSTIGWKYVNGILTGPDDAVKLVLPYDSDKMHAFSVNSSPLMIATCANCGKDVFR